MTPFCPRSMFWEQTEPMAHVAMEKCDIIMLLDMCVVVVVGVVVDSPTSSWTHLWTCAAICSRRGGQQPLPHYISMAFSAVFAVCTYVAPTCSPYTYAYHSACCVLGVVLCLARQPERAVPRASQPASTAQVLLCVLLQPSCVQVCIPAVDHRGGASFLWAGTMVYS